MRFVLAMSMRLNRSRLMTSKKKVSQFVHPEMWELSTVVGVTFLLIIHRLFYLQGYLDIQLGERTLKELGQVLGSGVSVFESGVSFMAVV